MSMTGERALRLVNMTRDKVDALFVELTTELDPTRADKSTHEVDATDSAIPAGTQTGSEAWSLGSTTLSGEWVETGRQKDVTYRWGDGNVDISSVYVTYEGNGGYTGMNLALGYLPNGDVIGFVHGPGGGSKRGLTCFFRCNDFEQTNELASMIRGGGPRGRSGFAPGAALPKGYAGFTTDVLGHRVVGKWNVQAVVAKVDDPKTMLAHTALQARLRRLA